MKLKDGYSLEESYDQPSSVQLLSHVWLSATPWTTARQASLSITNSQSSLEPMSIDSVMPSNHLILCSPLFLLPSIFPSIRVFSNDQPIQHMKKQMLLCQQRSSGQGYGFSNSHVWMWELDYKEGWVPKNWYFWTLVLEKTLESPLDCKEIQPVSCKGDQSWVFFGRTDVEAEIPILWPPDANSWLIVKGPDAGKDWGQEEKGTTEDEMAGWHHRLDAYEFG